MISGLSSGVNSLWDGKSAGVVSGTIGEDLSGSLSAHLGPNSKSEETTVDSDSTVSTFNRSSGTIENDKD